MSNAARHRCVPAHRWHLASASLPLRWPRGAGRSRRPVRFSARRPTPQARAKNIQAWRAPRLARPRHASARARTRMLERKPRSERAKPPPAPHAEVAPGAPPAGAPRVHEQSPIGSGSRRNLVAAKSSNAVIGGFGVPPPPPCHLIWWWVGVWVRGKSAPLETGKGNPTHANVTSAVHTFMRISPRERPHYSASCFLLGMGGGAKRATALDGNSLGSRNVHVCSVRGVPKHFLHAPDAGNVGHTRPNRATPGPACRGAAPSLGTGKCFHTTPLRTVDPIDSCSPVPSHTCCERCTQGPGQVASLTPATSPWHSVVSGRGPTVCSFRARAPDARKAKQRADRQVYSLRASAPWQTNHSGFQTRSVRSAQRERSGAATGSQISRKPCTPR